MDRNIALILFSILFYCCNENESNNQNDDKSNKHYSQIFKEVEKIFEEDKGKFWDHSLKGPILLVNPETRTTYSNQSTKPGSHETPTGIFINTLPENINIANTATDWKGQTWTMLMLPLPESRQARNNLIIHESFHRIQPEIGFDSLFEQANAHLDSYEGRLLLKLELEALIVAVHSIQEEQMFEHVRNALYIRSHRQSTPEIAQAENTLELNEGLAEYTGVMLSQRSMAELKDHYKNNISHFYKNKTFVRSFAYQTIPIYGYLLSKSNANWHKEITKHTNLTSFFKDAFSLDSSSIPSVENITEANDYNYKQILVEEESREKERLERIDQLKSIFLRDPTLKLHFENMNISFDPRNITPIENIGTVYPTLRVTDNWGVLEVKNGALLSEDWTHVIVTKPTNSSDSLVVGEGWSLNLSDEWKVVKRNKGYELTKIHSPSPD